MRALSVCGCVLLFSLHFSLSLSFLLSLRHSLVAIVCRSFSCLCAEMAAVATLASPLPAADIPCPTLPTDADEMDPSDDATEPHLLLALLLLPGDFPGDDPPPSLLGLLLPPPPPPSPPPLLLLLPEIDLFLLCGEGLASPPRRRRECSSSSNPPSKLFKRSAIALAVSPSALLPPPPPSCFTLPPAKRAARDPSNPSAFPLPSLFRVCAARTAAAAAAARLLLAASERILRPPARHPAHTHAHACVFCLCVLRECFSARANEVTVVSLAIVYGGF